MATKQEIIQLILSHINELKRQIEEYVKPRFGALLSLKTSRVNPIVRLVALMSLANSLIKNEEIDLTNGFEAIKNAHNIRLEDDKDLHRIYLQCKDYLKEYSANKAAGLVDAKQGADDLSYFQKKALWESLLIDDVEIIKIIADNIITDYKDYIRIYKITKGEARVYLQQTKFYDQFFMVSKEALFAGLKEGVVYIHSYSLAQKMLEFIKEPKDLEFLSDYLPAYCALDAILTDENLALKLYQDLFLIYENTLFNDDAEFSRFYIDVFFARKYLLINILNKLISHNKISERIAKNIVAIIIGLKEESNDSGSYFYERIKALAQRPDLALAMIKECKNLDGFINLAKKISNEITNENAIAIFIKHEAVVAYIATFFTKAEDLLRFREINISSNHPVFVVAV